MEIIALDRLSPELKIHYEICKKSSRAPKILRGDLGALGHTVGEQSCRASLVTTAVLRWLCMADYTGLRM
jgi:hypothetical protein